MVVYSGLWSNALRNDEDFASSAGRRGERRQLKAGAASRSARALLQGEGGASSLLSSCENGYGSLGNTTAPNPLWAAGPEPIPRLPKRQKAHSFHGEGSFRRPPDNEPQQDDDCIRRHETTGGDSIHTSTTSNSGGSSRGNGSDGSTDDSMPSLTAAFRSFENRPILVNCLYYLAVYYLVAIVAYSYVFERWTVIDSLYFATNTFTTCGYGNLEPTTTAGQLFTVCFAIYGVIILGVFIGIFGNFISETQSRAARKLRKRKETAILDTLFGGGGPPTQRQQTERFDTTTTATTINVTESERFGFDEYYDDATSPAANIATTTTAKPTAPDIQDTGGLWNDHVSLLDDVWRVVRGQSPVIALVGVLALILGVREGWSFMNTLYFSIMAATTTGFGDYTPRTQADKLYSIFFLPLAVAVFSEVLGRIATVYIQRKQRHLEAKHLHRTMTLCDLRNMDTNTDGAVDREEFILFMLQALQKVDRSTVQKLRGIFDALDRNGNGILEYDDLIEIRQSNYLPALEQVQEAVRQNGLLDQATKRGNGSDDRQPRPSAGHRRTRTSP